MEDKLFQEKFNQAWQYKKERKFSDAMELYDELYNQLIVGATKYARSFKNSEIDEGKTRKIMPQFFNKADEYLKKDSLTCTILNNMGVIFAEVGDNKSAKKYFEESIKYTPYGIDYQNPKIGIKELRK